MYVSRDGHDFPQTDVAKELCPQGLCTFSQVQDLGKSVNVKMLHKRSIHHAWSIFECGIILIAKNSSVIIAMHLWNKHDVDGQLIAESKIEAT